MTEERPIGEDDLQSYVDGRLAPSRRAALEAWLEENPASAAQVAAYEEQRRVLRDRLAFKAREPVPARLKVASLMAARRAPARFPVSLAAAAACLAIGLAAGGIGVAWLAGGGPPWTQRENVAGDAIAAHRTYVGERLHPVEVAADQEAHLVQWLSRRVGRPLQAPDLTRQGFQLMGGRLLPSGADPAALFMYQNGPGQRLTLYARSSPAERETAFRFETRDGVSAFSWVDRGLSYVVTGSIGREELLAVAQDIHRQLEAPPAPRQGSL